MILFLRLKMHSARLAVPATMLLLLLQRTPVLRLLMNPELLAGGRVGQVLRAMLPAALALGATHTLTGQTRWTTNPVSPVNGQTGTPLSVAFTASRRASQLSSIQRRLPPQRPFVL